MNSIELAKKIISIKSISLNEAEALKFLAEYFSENNASDVWQNDDFTAGLFKSKTENPTKKAILLTGHIDTVVSGKEENWQTSPWEAHEEDGKLFGLGASDMKAGLAASFQAGIDFWQKNSPDFDIWLVAVSREELDGSGSAKFVEWFKKSGYNYDEIYGIIAEPTGNSQIEIGHRGNRFVRLKFSGESGHASQQIRFEKSALRKATKFLKNINKLYSHLEQDFSNQILGIPSLVPTSIKSGNEESPNKIASEAEVILDIRTTPEFDDNFDKFFDFLAEKFDFIWEYHSQPVRSSLINKNTKIVEKLLKAASLEEESLTVSPGATDQGEFVNGLDAEVVVFGPGEFSQAHQPNEYIFIEKIERFYQMIFDLLKNFN